MQGEVTLSECYLTERCCFLCAHAAREDALMPGRRCGGKVTLSKYYLAEILHFLCAHAAREDSLMPGRRCGGKVIFSKCYLAEILHFLCAHAARRPISANSSRNRRKSAAKESGNQGFPLFCISPSYRFVHSPIPVSLLRPETKGAKASSYARFTVAERRELSNDFYLLRNHSK